jgi:acyl carrier protein
MEEFLSKVAEILEIPSATPELDFRTVDEWDSLKGFMLLVMLENDYGRPMTVERFLQTNTVGELARAAGL